MGELLDDLLVVTGAEELGNYAVWGTSKEQHILGAGQSDSCDRAAGVVRVQFFRPIFSEGCFKMSPCSANGTHSTSHR